jgi:hypothetical protein
MQQAAFPIGLHAGSHTHTPLLFSYFGYFSLLHRRHFSSSFVLEFWWFSFKLPDLPFSGTPPLSP